LIILQNTFFLLFKDFRFAEGLGLSEIVRFPRSSTQSKKKAYVLRLTKGSKLKKYHEILKKIKKTRQTKKKIGAAKSHTATKPPFLFFFIPL
jgi:hypothetical protein